MDSTTIDMKPVTMLRARNCTFATSFAVALSMLIAGASQARVADAQGADGGKVDGALWTFEMVPHDKNLQKRSGMFRVNGRDLYQSTDLEKGGWERKVGTKTHIVAPRNKKGKIVGQERTTIEFTDLQSDGRKYTAMTGKAELLKSKFGEWSGRYIDGDGLHWNFKCSRKQE